MMTFDKLCRKERSSSMYRTETMTAVLMTVIMVMYSENGHYISNYYGPGSGRVWLHGLRCRGDEASLANCTHDRWGISAYHCSHSYDVSISCSNVTAIGKKKLFHFSTFPYIIIII